MEKLFILHHEYEYTYKKEIFDEVKFIGVFSSKQKAEEAKNLLKNKKGFINYPEDCFIIGEIGVDTVEWLEGFITTEEAEKDINL
ncbi:hypothetical protein SAMN05443634_11616 [Chishuiella changwenlii]|uniref:DUF7336 domain-containing protein n=1 Tax=Chishuiella changwenlii TaxID=1434701 RepID=A0A1M7CYL1_9FLAO|nr:hypothetical protein [Chishuiella changwenlii]GGF11702.1 hypothetical protein GCM10010984_30880 [Chishuiella changwenlii]SHL72265.1 hypothetical protein SAMN05443634_11616 [Chishuiella changwenlii]